MDFHPIIVHFPIALLTVYSILECARWKHLLDEPWNHGTKLVMLSIGTCGSIAAIMTGGIAAEAFVGTPTMRLVELHSGFGHLSMMIYGLLTLTYLAHESKQRHWGQRAHRTVAGAIRLFEHIFCTLFRSWILVILAILGFIALGITGALGGALVYGKDADPIVSMIYHLLYR